MKKAVALCQDTDYEVRAAMCDQLNNIAKAVGMETAKRELLREYQELMVDEHRYVKERAMTNLIQLLDFLDHGMQHNHFFINKDTKVSFVIPSFKKHCEDKSDTLLPLVIKEFGVFLWNTKGIFERKIHMLDAMTENDLKLFMLFYQSMALGPNLDYRRKCAYNYPVRYYEF